jgi:hypothetical protein
MFNVELSVSGHGGHAVAALRGELDLTDAALVRITADRGRSGVRAAHHRGSVGSGVHRLLRPESARARAGGPGKGAGPWTLSAPAARPRGLRDNRPDRRLLGVSEHGTGRGRREAGAITVGCGVVAKL